jgi:asparagine synthase (glutamine-hydrolysing)
MCGIAGIHAAGGDADPRLVAAMVAQLAHRGPDGDGFYDAPGIALGMRRLAIIDPEGGRQPLFNEREDVVAVFNGELYNHAELRVELERRGHRLRSGSDGEVIPHLYEEHGIKFVERLNGIFAIALWDAREQVLHLTRDRFGVKPLYFSQAGGRVAFSSEVRALLADGSVSRELDAAAIDHFLTFRFVPSPRTALAAVRKLEPATVLSFGPTGVRTTRYATEVPSADRTDRPELVEEYRAAFELAVARQMMSDRPIGVMLSGGVDSGAVCAAMAHNATQVRAYTVGFAGGGAETDEIPQAARTARVFGARHESMVIGEREYLDALPGAMAGIEEPTGTTSALAVRFVAELMRPAVPVALCGQGADEPLGGYGRHRGARLAELLRRVPGARTAAARLPRPGGAVTLSRGLDALAARDDLGLLMNAYRLLRDYEKANLYRPEFAARVREAGSPPEEPVERLRSRVADRSPLGQMLYVDTRLWLPDELLLIADKMSMAASVELRVPFLDCDLVAVADSAHPLQHVHHLRGKSLHKKAMLGLLPRDVVHRPKLGWQTPVDRWLRAELRPLTEEVLLGEDGACRSLFEERELRRLIDAHASGAADHTRQLFCLLSLGLWHRELVNERPAPPPSPTAVAAAPRPGTQ